MVTPEIRTWWLVVAGLLALGGCTTNPMTGRSQFMVVSEEYAIRGSASAYTSMIGGFSKKNKIETDSTRVERVRDITNRLVAEAVRIRPDSANWAWEVQVIDEPKIVNAFCMAGGKMGIYTGFWEKFKATDDEIAQVMGHEIGHALADHTRERMSVGMAAGMGASVLAILASSRNNEYDPNLQRRNEYLLATAAALAITLPNSRESETEADQIGIELAARAGFDPRAAVTLWKKMGEKEGGHPLEFLSTHPSPENRMQRLETLIARVEPHYQQAKERKDAAQIPTFVGVSRNERVVGEVSREEYVAKAAAEAQTLSFVTEDFEKFRSGELVLQCTGECVLDYTLQKSRWKQLYDKQSWRDLAVSVVRVGYQNDLTYYYLAEAAKGLNAPEAAGKYYVRALEAAKANRSCAGLFNTCDGLDVARLAESALAGR